MSRATEIPRNDGTRSDVRTVAEADIVVIGDVEFQTAGLAVARLDRSVDVSAFADSAQPTQLWLIVEGTSGADRITETVRSSGASVAVVDSTERAADELIKHLRHLLDEHREWSMASYREVAALRRELNRALSALGDRHAVLGLMTSVTLEELNVYRGAEVQLRPENPWSLMSRTDATPVTHAPFESISESTKPAGSADDRVRELAERLDEAQRHLALVYSTKTMRLVRIPRRVYARFRLRASAGK